MSKENPYRPKESNPPKLSRLKRRILSVLTGVVGLTGISIGTANYRGEDVAQAARKMSDRNTTEQQQDGTSTLPDNSSNTGASTTANPETPTVPESENFAEYDQMMKDFLDEAIEKLQQAANENSNILTPTVKEKIKNIENWEEIKKIIHYYVETVMIDRKVSKLQNKATSSSHKNEAVAKLIENNQIQGNESIAELIVSGKIEGDQTLAQFINDGNIEGAKIYLLQQETGFGTENEGNWNENFSSRFALLTNHVIKDWQRLIEHKQLTLRSNSEYPAFDSQSEIRSTILYIIDVMNNEQEKFDGFDDQAFQVLVFLLIMPQDTIEGLANDGNGLVSYINRERFRSYDIGKFTQAAEFNSDQGSTFSDVKGNLSLRRKKAQERMKQILRPENVIPTL